MFRIRLHLLLYNWENWIEVNNPVNIGRIFYHEVVSAVLGVTLWGVVRKYFQSFVLVI